MLPTFLYKRRSGYIEMYNVKDLVLLRGLHIIKQYLLLCPKGDVIKTKYTVFILYHYMLDFTHSQ